MLFFRLLEKSNSSTQTRLPVTITITASFSGGGGWGAKRFYLLYSKLFCDRNLVALSRHTPDVISLCAEINEPLACRRLAIRLVVLINKS